MRCHHQETHVIDDILGRQQRAVFMGGAAQLREQVLAPLGAADRNLFGEVGDDAFAPLHAARHLCARPGLADRRDRCRDHVDECARDLVDFGTDAGAEKGRCGEIERELLHRGVEQHWTGRLPPSRHAFQDASIELRKIGFHRAGFERNR